VLDYPGTVTFYKRGPTLVKRVRVGRWGNGKETKVATGLVATLGALLTDPLRSTLPVKAIALLATAALLFPLSCRPTTRRQNR
jgi:hypothetical protein